MQFYCRVISFTFANSCNKIKQNIYFVAEFILFYCTWNQSLKFYFYCRLLFLLNGCLLNPKPCLLFLTMDIRITNSSFGMIIATVVMPELDHINVIKELLCAKYDLTSMWSSEVKNIFIAVNLRLLILGTRFETGPF